MMKNLGFTKFHLSQLISTLNIKKTYHFSPEDSDSEICGITSDTRHIKARFVFVAVSGTKFDGNQFVGQALDCGACAIVSEVPPGSETKVPYFEVLNSRLALAILLARFYGDCSHAMRVIGITGTSGKTTSTFLLEAIFSAQGEKTGVIGTNNYRIENTILETGNTTPSPEILHKLLKQMKDLSCSTVLMEVSSHALDQSRVAHVAFDAVSFTNLSAEHQDYHFNMEDYYLAKEKLFKDCLEYSKTAGKNPTAVINRDDAWGKRLLKEMGMAPVPMPVLTYGISKSSEPDLKQQLYFGNLQSDAQGIRGEIVGPLGIVSIHSRLIGLFNCYNILGVVGVAQALGVPAPEICRGIQNLKVIPGRLESIENTQGIHVFVDYAHKPDALESVLKVLKDLTTQTAFHDPQNKRPPKLVTVFGCGGDRDRQKRPEMGKISVTYSDFVIITSDNPRTEDPENILQEIIHGIPQSLNNKFKKITDRKTAIAEAVKLARAGDFLLIAGKGHEDYQVIGSQKAPFDDRDIVRSLLGLVKK